MGNKTRVIGVSPELLAPTEIEFQKGKDIWNLLPLGFMMSLFEQDNTSYIKKAKKPCR